MNPPFTLRDMLEAPTAVFKEMIQDISDYEKKIVLKSFQNHANLLRTWH